MPIIKSYEILIQEYKQTQESHFDYIISITGWRLSDAVHQEVSGELRFRLRRRLGGRQGGLHAVGRRADPDELV